MYERRDEVPIPRNKFYRRMTLHLGISILIVLVSAGIGITGFMYFEHYSWQKAFLHATILLSGLGLAEIPESNPGKIFVSLYGLYASLIFLIAAGIVITPAIHRLLHKFHWTKNGDKK